LTDTDLKNYQASCQSHINTVRGQLNSGLDSPIFVQIPALFKKGNDEKAVALIPGMVNMLVVGNTLVIAKPFGPKNPTKDVFEDTVEARLTGFDVRFVDDWDTYHSKYGEIHCGTNVKRTPPSTNWWE